MFIYESEAVFYNALISIVGKIGRIASEEVILELVEKKSNASSIVRPRRSNNYQSIWLTAICRNWYADEHFQQTQKISQVLSFLFSNG